MKSQRKNQPKKKKLMKRSNLLITLAVLFIGSTVGGLFNFTPTETAVAASNMEVPRFIDVPRQNDVKIDVNVTTDESVNGVKPKYITVTVEKPTYVVNTKLSNLLLNKIAKLDVPKNNILKLANCGEDKPTPALE